VSSGETRGRPAKSLSQLLREGAFRPARHKHLLLEGRPADVPEADWAKLIERSFGIKAVEPDGPSDTLTADEEIAHERLLDGLDAKVADRLRDRPVHIKRMDVKVQMLNPLDVLQP
jgi:hypothetical protein